MEEIPVTRTHLESLTTGDLIRVADNWGIDIPPDLDRIFIIEELLEAASQEDAEQADTFAAAPDEAAVPGGTKGPDADETALLPKQYNISFIEVMIRDPLWAFVFWEIKAADKELFEKAQDFDGFYLKVSSWVPAPDKSRAPAEGPPRQGNETNGTFTVPVKSEDTAWYLGLAPTVETGKPRTAAFTDHVQYKVELCAGRRGEETILAASKPFRLPLLHELPAGTGKQEARSSRVNPLVRLSGYGDFHILRNNERVMRTKRSGSADSYE